MGNFLLNFFVGNFLLELSQIWGNYGDFLRSTIVRGIYFVIFSCIFVCVFTSILLSEKKIEKEFAVLIKCSNLSLIFFIKWQIVFRHFVILVYERYNLCFSFTIILRDWKKKEKTKILETR